MSSSGLPTSSIDTPGIDDPFLVGDDKVGRDATDQAIAIVEQKARQTVSRGGRPRPSGVSVEALVGDPLAAASAG